MRINSKWWVVLVIFVMSCNKDDINTQLLQGVIGSISFEYAGGISLYNPAEGHFESELLSFSEENQCYILPRNEGSIYLEIPDEIGHYQIPSEIAVEFRQPGIDGAFLNATSGFVDVIGIGGRRIDAYLQALYDEDNSVEGEFVIERCN